MTVTSASPCINAVDQMILHINKQAIVNAGADATICETGTFTLSGATSSYATSLLWTTSGTGTFSNATALNPVYTPSIADIAAGIVTLTLTGQSAGPCIPATDFMVLTIHQQATANAGVDAAICQGSTYTLSTAVATDALSILWTTSGTGSFNSATSQNPVYTPSQNDIDDGSVILTMTVTSASPCTTASNAMTLIISHQAVVYAGSDVTICQGTAYTVSGATALYAVSVLWTHNGTGTLTNAATLTPTYTPSFLTSMRSMYFLEFSFGFSLLFSSDRT